MQFLFYKDFLDLKDLNKIKKDIEKNFKSNKHRDFLKSGVQTKPNLHLINTGQHWKNYYTKLKNIMTQLKKYKLTKSWSLKVNKKQENFFHVHQKNSFTSILYVQNKNYELGTHLKQENLGGKHEIIIPGYENSIAIFSGDIMHDAVFPNYTLKKPRYTLITDYE
jgi:hypothetical protein